MKKINIIAAALVLIFSASCDRKMEFNHETFATFDAVSFSVDETAGKVVVPVSIYNPTGSEIQVTVKAIEGKATEGVDFEILSPASGLLTFNGEETTKNIEISITDYSGEFTGAKDFRLEIASATDGVKVGALNTAYFNIKDLDHPLATFIGEWTGSIGSYFDGAMIPMTFQIKADEEDATFTRLVVENFDPSIFSNGGTAANGYNIYEATVNEAKTQIVISTGQPTGIPGYMLVGFNTDSIETASGYEDIVIDYADDKLSIQKGWGSTDGTGYWYGIYFGGAVFTRN